jgi:hypothetical protein
MSHLSVLRFIRLHVITRQLTVVYFLKYGLKDLAKLHRVILNLIEMEELNRLYSLGHEHIFTMHQPFEAYCHES